MLRTLLVPLALALILPTLAAAEDRRPDAPTAQGRLEALLDRFMDRLEPSMDALGDVLDDMIGDFPGWHAPEILPNGDILIRRRTQPGAAPDESPEDRFEDPEPPVTEPFEL
jgi:hypothetical protein